MPNRKFTHVGAKVTANPTGHDGRQLLGRRSSLNGRELWGFKKKKKKAWGKVSATTVMSCTHTKATQDAAVADAAEAACTDATIKEQKVLLEG